MRPHVVILSAFITPFRSGAEACAEEIAQCLSDRYRITIVTARLRRDLPEREFVGTVEIVRVGNGGPSDKWFFALLAPAAVRSLKPDLIHAVLESYAGLAMIRCRFRFPHIKRLLTCQSTNTSLLLRMMHRSADAVTVISRVLQERAARLGRPEAMLIPNGVRYEQIRAAAHRHPKIPGRILFVGRLENMKGVDTLLRAFAALVPRPRKSVPIMHLHIVGSGSKRAMLEKLSHKLHLDEWVSFQGRLDGEQLLQEYAEAEIFCGLSRSEALGNVFLEAEAAGCAVVATNVGGIPDIVENGRTGLLVAAGDPAGAAEALESLLRDPMLRKKLMAEGIERMKKYDWKILAQRYEEVYEKLIG